MDYTVIFILFSIRPLVIRAGYPLLLRALGWLRNMRIFWQATEDWLPLLGL